MKILVIDAYHDSDRGGVGILAGLVHSLRTAVSRRKEPLQISVVYRFSSNDPRFDTATRHAKQMFPDIRILGSPINTSPIVGYTRVLRGVGLLIRSVLLLLAAGWSRNPVCVAIREADLVISKGGHFYHSYEHRPVWALLQLYKNAYALLLCRRLGKPVHLVSQSFGPFVTPTARAFMRFTLRTPNVVAAREETSAQLLRDLGVQSQSVSVLPDTAFALLPKPPTWAIEFASQKGIGGDAYAVITPRPWRFPGKAENRAKDAYGRYVRSLAAGADALLEKRLVKRVVLVVHNDGKHSVDENDATAVRDVFDAMKRHDEALIIDDDLRPDELAAFYGQAAATVAVRMHSAIFACVGGGLPVAISYTHKSKGIMAMLGLGDYVCDIAEVTADRVFQLVASAIQNQERLRRIIRSRVAEFRDEIVDYLAQITSGSWQ